MSEKPKLCPICSKDARVFREGRNFEGKPIFQVRCKRSRCEISTKTYLNPKKAIKAWNTRTPQPLPQIEDLKKRLPPPRDNRFYHEAKGYNDGIDAAYAALMKGKDDE